MSFRLVIHDDAREDINRNADWWAEHHSLNQALVWFDAIYEQLETLRELPERHPLAVENPKFPFDIHEKLIGVGSRPSYRAIFTIQGDVVHVLTIQRAAQGVVGPEDISFRPEST